MTITSQSVSTVVGSATISPTVEPDPLTDKHPRAAAADPVRAHLEAICTEAGLGVMLGIFEVLRDRETLDEDALLGLTSGDVSNYYFDSIAPAVDAIEDALI